MVKNEQIISNKDWSIFPKFRHNLLTTYDDNPDVTYLRVSHAQFEIPTTQAKEFLNIRTFCTGHNDLEEIAKKSKMPKKRVKSILKSLITNNVIRPKSIKFENYSPEEIQDILLTVTGMWAEQLEETYIAANIKNGKETRNTLVGWLLETYHYIKDFPAIILAGAAHATGELKRVLEQYAAQEKAHEKYVLDVLLKLGFKKEEVEISIPLVSTKLIHLLMKELVVIVPSACLLIARMVEADGEASLEQLIQFADEVEKHYKLEPGTCASLTKHTLIDHRAGHAVLAQKYRHLLKMPSGNCMDFVVNSLHDIKHAFDNQSLEIKDYYNKSGNYIPRQFVDRYSI
jgi:hypothetical protein